MAQGSILEQMQTEISNISEKVRSAVVTIQDERAIAFGADVFLFSVPSTTLAEEMLQLETDIKLYTARLDQLQKERADCDQKVKLGLALHSTLEQVDGNIRSIQITLEGAKKRWDLKRSFLKAWEQRGNLHQIVRPRILKEINLTEANLSRSKVELTDLNAKYTANAPQVKATKARVEALTKRLHSLQSQAKGTHLFEPVENMVLNHNNGFLDLRVNAPQIGSGFSIGEGYIVTTSDVLQGVRSPVVVTDSGTRLRAQVVGKSNEMNIGLLKLVAKTELPSLSLGDSESVRSGHFAVSIGNQSGQPNSVSLLLVGNVRNGGTYAGNQFYNNLIQITGGIGNGNSGAPLVNVRGEVIGMMAAIPVNEKVNLTQQTQDNLLRFWNVPPPPKPKELTGVQLNIENHPEFNDPNAQVRFFQEPLFAPRPESSSIGFAIPINQIRGVVSEFRSGTPIIQGWIGIAPEDVVQAIEKEGIIEVNRSVKITGIYPDSPAFHAGLQPGDIIIQLNSKPIKYAAEIREASLRLRKGEVLSMTINRPKETRKVILRIDARPATIKPPIMTPIKESF
jgi:S1-C subfamily serine protease